MSEGTKRINVFTPINSLGYGIAGKNTTGWLTKLLHKRDQDESGTSWVDHEYGGVTLFPIGNQITCETEGEQNFFTQLAQNQLSFDADAPCLKIWHENAMAERIGRGKLTGYSFFEMDRFEDSTKNSILSTDNMVVASEWAKEIVEDQTGHENVFVVPLGVDEVVFSQRQEQQTDKFIVFNCGKWEKRKGHDILLSIFNKAFPEEQDVELWMMCENPFSSQEETIQWEAHYKQDSRCRLIKRVATQLELANIMAMSSCGIFPSRAEGWNLEALEMMSLGKPVILTDYSAHQQFCNIDNSILVKPNKTELAVDGKFFKGTGDWASLNDKVDEFADGLRSVYDKWKKGDSLVNQAGIETAKELSWENTAKKLLEIIANE